MYCFSFRIIFISIYLKILSRKSCKTLYTWKCFRIFLILSYNKKVNFNFHSKYSCLKAFKQIFFMKKATVTRPHIYTGSRQKIRLFFHLIMFRFTMKCLSTSGMTGKSRVLQNCWQIRIPYCTQLWLTWSDSLQSKLNEFITEKTQPFIYQRPNL